MINKYVVRCLAALIAIFLAVGLVEYAHLNSLERDPQLFSAAPPALPAPHLNNDPRPAPPPLSETPSVTAPPQIKDTSPVTSRPTDPNHGASSVLQGAAALVHVVQPGDTLWDLAAAHLGNPTLWPELFALNQGRQEPDGRVFVNPNLIYPGWTISFPIAVTGSQSAASAELGTPSSAQGNPPIPTLALGSPAKGGSQ
jgi:hypothetical protein